MLNSFCIFFLFNEGMLLVCDVDAKGVPTLLGCPGALSDAMSSIFYLKKMISLKY